LLLTNSAAFTEKVITAAQAIITAVVAASAHDAITMVRSL
jgi:hypothetical protein